MDPLDPTPSARVTVPSNNFEQIEARQAGIDAERLAYIEIQEEPNKTRLLAVEQAVDILIKNKITFYLIADPEPNRTQGWLHYRGTYTLDEQTWVKENAAFLWRMMVDALYGFSKTWRLTFGVYDKDKLPVMSISYESTPPTP